MHHTACVLVLKATKYNNTKVSTLSVNTKSCVTQYKMQTVKGIQLINHACLKQVRCSNYYNIVNVLVNIFIVANLPIYELFNYIIKNIKLISYKLKKYK